jgi:hypothetical protein
MAVNKSVGDNAREGGVKKHAAEKSAHRDVYQAQ